MDISAHQPVTAALLAAVLIAAGVCDWRTGTVPNAITYPAILLGLGWAVFAGWLAAGGSGLVTGAERSLFGLGVGLIPFAIVFTAGGLGGGDVKLMGAVGAISADWRCVLATAVYALLIGAVMAVVLMVRHGLVKRTLRRLFGAALLRSARVRPELDADTPRVPFAAAIGAGGLLAAAELFLGLPTPWAALGP